MADRQKDGSITYAQAGVDIEEGARAVQAIRETVHSTYRDEVIGDIGGFGGLFSIAAAKDMHDPVLVSGTDGVGTKLKVAQMLGKKEGTVTRTITRAKARLAKELENIQKELNSI